MANKLPLHSPVLEGRELPRISDAKATLAIFREQITPAVEKTKILMENVAPNLPPPSWGDLNMGEKYAADLEAFRSDPEANFEHFMSKVMQQFWDDLGQAVINNEGSSCSPDLKAAVLIAFKGFEELMCAILSAYRYETTLMAFVQLQEAFNALQSLPAIQTAPLAADFVARLGNDLGQSRDPREILASVGISTSAQLAADTRHAPARELKRRALEEYNRLKSANPRLSKNAAASKIAPLAMGWNTELTAGLGTMASIQAAETQIRRWLSPSAQGDAMR